MLLPILYTATGLSAMFAYYIQSILGSLIFGYIFFILLVLSMVVTYEFITRPKPKPELVREEMIYNNSREYHIIYSHSDLQVLMAYVDHAYATIDKYRSPSRGVAHKVKDLNGTTYWEIELTYYGLD